MSLLALLPRPSVVAQGRRSLPSRLQRRQRQTGANRPRVGRALLAPSSKFTSRSPSPAVGSKRGQAVTTSSS
eukprot:15066069-Alexandrium_andersonii.AAC.1